MQRRCQAFAFWPVILATLCGAGFPTDLRPPARTPSPLIAPESSGYLNGTDPAVFNSPTVQSTSIIRAWIHSLFTTGTACLPLDSLNLYPWLTQDYIYPTDGQISPTTPATSACNGQCAACAVPAAAGQNSLYLNLRNQVVTGYCKAAAITLWAAYKAFGYAARESDWMNGIDFQYSDAHAVTEVFLADVNAYVMQDPTFNVSGYAPGCETNGSCIDANGLHSIETSYLQANTALPPLSDNGYTFGSNLEWSFPQNAPQLYYGYFGTIASVLSTWMR